MFPTRNMSQNHCHDFCQRTTTHPINTTITTRTFSVNVNVMLVMYSRYSYIPHYRNFFHANLFTLHRNIEYRYRISNVHRVVYDTMFSGVISRFESFSSHDLWTAAGNIDCSFRTF